MRVNSAKDKPNLGEKQ